MILYIQIHSNFKEFGRLKMIQNNIQTPKTNINRFILQNSL